MPETKPFDPEETVETKPPETVEPHDEAAPSPEGEAVDPHDPDAPTYKAPEAIDVSPTPTPVAPPVPAVRVTFGDPVKVSPPPDPEPDWNKELGELWVPEMICFSAIGPVSGYSLRLVNHQLFLVPSLHLLIELPGPVERLFTLHASCLKFIKARVSELLELEPPR